MPDLISIARLKVRHALTQGERGKHALATYVHQVENSLSAIFNETFSEVTGCALIALGGLARRTLCPYSDVDVWILLADASNSIQLKAAEKFVQKAWRLQLHLAQSIGSKEELLKRCALDDQAATAALEARFSAGSAIAAQDFLAHFRTQVLPHHRQNWIQAKLKERRQRHQKEGHRVQRLEPHLKNAPGGLRELDTVTWLLLLRTPLPVQNDGIQLLLEHGLLHLREALELQESREVLLSLRAALQIIRKRQDDRLAYDVLGEVTEMLSINASDDLSAIERTLQFYFKAALKIRRTVDIIIERFLIEEELRTHPELSLKKDYSPRHLKLPAEFFIKGHRLYIRNPQYFTQKLSHMIDVVRISAELNIPLAARTKSQLLSEVESITQKNTSFFYDDKATGTALMQLARSTKITGNPFAELLELGILPLALRDFSRLFCRFKADGYHALSTDAHLAHCADLALQYIANSSQLTTPLSSLFQKNTFSHLLVLAALFHDIGKGKGGKHEEIGVQLFLSEAARLSLNNTEKNIICNLIQKHLELSYISQRRDLADPEVIEELANSIETEQNLLLLTQLTVVDISAVAPGMFTSWKAQLLTRCFEKVSAQLKRNSSVADNITHNTPAKVNSEKEIQQNAIHALVQEQGKALEHLASQFIFALPPRYLGSRHPQALKEDFLAWKTFLQQEQETLVLIDQGIEKTILNRLIIRIFTPDRPGLFADLASSISAEGFNILHLHLTTFKKTKQKAALAMDTFIVEARHESHIARESLPTFKEVALKAAKGQAKRYISRRSSTGLNVTTKIHIPERLDHWGNTIVEVRTKDRPGVLADIANVFRIQGWRVSLAMASTDGHVVRDNFYLRRSIPFTNKKSASLARKKLGKDLLQVLHEASVL